MTKLHWNEYHSDHVQIDCDNGHVITADHVVITVSLGYLKSEHSELFDPALPREKIESIEHLAFGSVDKIIVQFDEQLLDGRCRRIDLLWNGDEDENHHSKEKWHRQINSVEFISPNTVQGR